ncbi:MAG: hypothetical protein EU548_08135 [Promethearchaeota archaeon]|nr:MAG: hypothetical protein EU548_08135 [Candidatus Lokiarchaeota archaeon]
MSDSDRTSITLSKILWDLVDDCVGTIGYNRSQVIGVVLQDFFKKPENLKSIEKLKNIREKKLKKAIREQPKEPDIIEQKIKEILTFSTKIKKETFLDYLEITEEYFKDNVYEWSQKFDFVLEMDVIKKKIK